MTQYPMIYNQTEKERLDAQANALSDTSLGVLIKKSKNCLEIGCGVGSNLPVIRHINPNIHFTGIDVNEYALATARDQYGHYPQTEFLNMDLRNLSFPEGHFDLIISKLVLWSVGKEWQEALPGIRRILSSGGSFYSFEPDDRFLMFYPHKPAAQELVRLWQEKTLARGLNPFIGREISRALFLANFENVSTFLHTQTTQGSNENKYKECATNLMGIFTSRGPEHIGLAADDPSWQKGIQEFMKFGTSDMIVEGYFVTVGTK